MLECIGVAKSLIDAMIAVKEKMLPGRSARSHNFVELVDPLFKELHPVVDNYFVFFRKALYLIARATTDDEWKNVSHELMEGREKLIVTRIAIRGEAELLAEACHDKPTGHFFRCVASIFDAPDVPTNTAKQISASANIVSLAQQLALDPTQKDGLNSTLEASLRHIEKRWEATVQSYYRLRVHHLVRREIFVPQRKRSVD